MNIYYIAGFPVSDELYHYGIQGQKWGIRRYQNPDGTLTAEGRARYCNRESGDSNQSKIIVGAYRYDDSGSEAQLRSNVKKQLDDAFNVAKKVADTDRGSRAWDEAIKRHPEDLKNIDKPWKQSKETIKAAELDRKIWRFHDRIMSNMTMDIVRDLPPSQRDAAMAYVRDLCNWG